VDDTHAYYVESNTLSAVALKSGEAATLVSTPSVAALGDLAVDADAVYFTTAHLDDSLWRGRRADEGILRLGRPYRPRRRSNLLRSPR
jgi:hypothetical protein